MGSRDEFPAFPFEPYAIQMQLMKAVYAALEKGGVAIVESPTGTGKTLSLICSVLQWLEDRASSPNAITDNNSEEPDWMRDFSTSRPRPKPIPKKATVSKNFFGLTVDSKGTNKAHKTPSSEDDDTEFLLEDYDSDDSSRNNVAKRKQNELSSDSSDSEPNDEDEEGGGKSTRIFFCSRTHSQLSQFIHELKRTKFAESMTTISLGSRKTLCINQDVLRLRSASRINDRCLELQKKNTAQKVGGNKTKKSKTTGCPFIRKHRLQKHFKQHVLDSEPKDIEDLVHIGQQLGTCPYYGSRSLVQMADVVVLPYQSLLHTATREALGVKLKGSVVIFDEAHNLVDTVTNTYTFQISGSQLRQVNSQLSHYLTRFKSRLAAGNRRYIQTLLVLVEALTRRLSETGTKKAEIETNREIMTINDFVFSLGIDNINLFKLCRYIKESNIVNKVSSYGDKYLASNETEERPGTTAGFHALADFLLALTTAQTDGRVLLIPKSSDADGQFKFLMLDAAKQFSEIVEQARTVILAGGTLQPVSELRQRLLFQVPDESVHLFSCGHIVSSESILPLAISKGPSGKILDFTYQSRSSSEMIEELGRLIVNISSIVPEGMVVFFPSFDYESQVQSKWEKSGILASIGKKKRVFREPRNASAVESTLAEYRKSITDAAGGGGGAIIFCIVGGKMSEGINFSDGMGRCVVMVGLPYPSPSDPELAEKMKYVDRLGNNSSTSKHNMVTAVPSSSSLLQCGQKGKEYYEDLCMKAVNQSIGRAIRHVKDYAAILLLDARYTKGAGPVTKLPGWIKEHLVVIQGGFGEVQKHLHRFFKHNKAETRTMSAATS